MLACGLYAVVGFHAPSSIARASRCSAPLLAEGALPQIEWQDASVVSNEPLSRGTMQLRLRASAPHSYRAGHILGFEMAHPESGEGLKGPYTVSRGAVAADDRAFDLIYRVIPSGRKTPFMEKLAAGDTVRFGGRFGVPVDEGIAPECDRFVGIATGAGIGPLVGFAEAALAREDGPRVELYCGFRDLADVAGAACDALAAAHPERFSWRPIVSQPMACTAVNLAGLDGGGGDGAAAAAGPLQGRVSTVVPGLLGELGAATHFHLVGNGQFVVDFKKGLLDGGIAEGRVTTEKYFNGKAVVDDDVAKFVADAVREQLVVAA